MILLEPFRAKLFISIKPDNPPVDLYMTGIIRKLEEKREEDLEYIDKLTYELELNKSVLKAANNEVEDYLFQLEEKKETIESQKAEIKHYEDITKTQEDEIEELKSELRGKELKEERIKSLEDEIEELKSKNETTIPDEHWHIALDTEREKRLQLQIKLSSVTELVRKLNNVIT